MKYLLLLSVLAVSAPAKANQPMLQWCLDHLPPRHLYQPGMTQPSGPMVDMMIELAQRSGFKLSYSVPTPSERCLKKLAAGQTDIVTGVVDTPQRKQLLLLAPFDTARTDSWFVRADDQLKDKSVMTRIALIKDKPYRDSLLAELQQQGHTLLVIDSLADALAMLLLNEVDAVVGSEHIISHAIASQPRYHNQLVLFETHADTTPQHANLAMSPQGPHAVLFGSISTELSKMRAEGKTRFYAEPAAK